MTKMAGQECSTGVRWLLAAAIGLALAGCGSNGTSATDSGARSTIAAKGTTATNSGSGGPNQPNPGTANSETPTTQILPSGTEAASIGSGSAASAATGSASGEATSEPAGSQIPNGGAITEVGLEANGNLVVLAVGQMLHVTLTENWTPPHAATTADSTPPLQQTAFTGFPDPVPATASFTAMASGNTTVTANTDNTCLHTPPACTILQQTFTLFVRVT